MRLTVRGTLPLGTAGSVILLFAFTGIQTPLWCQDDTVRDALITPFRDAIYKSGLESTGLDELYRAVLVSLEDPQIDPVDRLRLAALTHYYMGRYHQAVKTPRMMASYADDLRNKRYLELRSYYPDRDSALSCYRLALTAAREYLTRQPGAGAHSLIGEILGQMIFLGTAVQAFSTGPEARTEVRRALECDPGHTKSRIQEASRLAYTPRGYGGNPGRAREIYHEVLRNGHPDREDLFNIYGGLGMGSFMDGEDDLALYWFREASGVFPGNVFAEGMILYLRDGAP